MNHADHNQRTQGEHSQHAGHAMHAGHSVENFKKKFYVCLIVTLPILLLSPLIQGLLQISIEFPGDWLVSFLLASFVFFYGGSPFLLGALSEIRRRTPGMMTLISLAIVVAYFYSSAVVFGLPGEVFFWELATLIDIMLLGHWLEMKSVMGASTALKKLSALIPDTAHLRRKDKIVDVSVSKLKKGDIILVKPGERIPTDCIIIKGESFVDESMLTGESKPVFKESGSKVIGGSIVEEGALESRVIGVGAETYLSKVIELVRDAQGSKSKTQLLADRCAFWLTIIAISIGAITFIAWMALAQDIAFSIERMATVLIMTCPHALGLAVPLVVAISTTLSAQNGLLIKNRTAFENARKISTIIFDKTGTLTQGTFSLKKIYVLRQDYTEDGILQMAEALEQGSEHPIARAIITEAQNRKLKKIAATHFKAIKGEGVEAMVNGKKTIIASARHLKKLDLAIPASLNQVEGTVVFIVVVEDDGCQLIGALNLSDIIRPESYAAVKLLRGQEIKMWMLTGDNESSARGVTEALGLDGYFAGVLPHQKQEKIKELQAKGEFVAMVGDGINDAPALAQADVGIAIGSGTDIAAETADIILVNSNPKDIASLVLLGKATYKKILQNLGWATGYNVVAIPLAAGILASPNMGGIVLSPALGAIFMSLSTVVVAINAKRLRIRR